MTNKEIRDLCVAQQEKRGENYPAYKFKITQTKQEVKIYWEYLDGECWTIRLDEEDYFVVKNEHGEIMNCELEDTLDLEYAIKSAVYYMNTRY